MKKSGRLGQGGIIREDHMICSLRTSSLTFLKNTIHQDTTVFQSHCMIQKKLTCRLYFFLLEISELIYVFSELLSDFDLLFDCIALVLIDCIILVLEVIINHPSLCNQLPVYR